MGISSTAFIGALETGSEDATFTGSAASSRGDLSLYQIQIWSGSVVRHTVAQMFQCAGRVLFVAKNYGQQLLGVGLRAADPSTELQRALFSHVESFEVVLPKRGSANTSRLPVGFSSRARLVTLYRFRHFSACADS